MPGPEATHPDPSERTGSPEVKHEVPQHSELNKTFEWLDHDKRVEFILAGVEKSMEREGIGIGDFNNMEELKTNTFDQNHPRREGIHVFLQNNGENEKGIQEVTLAVELNNGGGEQNENTVFMINAQVIEGKLVLKQNSIVHMTNEASANELLQANLSEKDAKKIGRQNTYLTMQLFRGNMSVDKYKQEIKRANGGKELRQLHEENDRKKRNSPGIEYLQRNAEYQEFRDTFIKELLAEHEEIKNVVDNTEEELKKRRAETRTTRLATRRATEQARQQTEEKRHEAAMKAKQQVDAEREAAELARHEAAMKTKQEAESPQDQEDEEPQIDSIESAEWILALIEDLPSEETDQENRLRAAASIRKAIARMRSEGSLDQSGEERAARVIKRLDEFEMRKP